MKKRMVSMDVFVDERYVDVMTAYLVALEQIQGGKGMERHGTDEPFKEQTGWRIIKEEPGFARGQARKKLCEAARFEDIDSRIHETAGALNYIAFEILRLLEIRNDKRDS